MNEQKFNKKGSVYAKSRPNYPDELFSYLLKEQIITKDSVAADIGSGTGIFSLRLAKFVKTVYAVEPNSDMRANAKEKFKFAGNIVSVAATAEDTSLEEGSVDIVTAAQAFHWFDKAKFKSECKRILKKDGMVLLVWNDRDEKSDIIVENFKVNSKYCPDFKGSSNGFDFENTDFSDFFNGEYRTVEFENSLIYDEEAFIGRSLSSSYAPTPDNKEHQDYIAALKEVFAKHSSNGAVKYPYITRCYLGCIKTD